jgi:ribosome maturation factor RimP
MKQTPIERKLNDLINPIVKDRGLRLVHVSLQGAEHGHTLQVLAENPETRNLGIEDCAQLSRSIGAILDVEDVVSGAYRLEVSSPGIDRPLVNREDFTTFANNEVKIEIEPAFNGQKRFKGVLLGEKDGEVLLKTDEGEIALPLDSVHKARLDVAKNALKKNEPKAKKTKTNQKR